MELTLVLAARITAKLPVTASGDIRFGNFVIRRSRTRRTFWDWLLRRRPLPAGELPSR